MSSKLVRVSYRLKAGIGLQSSSEHAGFDASYARYSYLRSRLGVLVNGLEQFAAQLHHVGENSRALADALFALYGENEEGRSAAAAFKACRDETYGGYLANLKEALINGVLEEVRAWQQRVHELEKYIQDFKESRLKHDHYQRKVMELQAQAIENERKSKDIGALKGKLERNEAKLKDVLDAYELTSDLCCSHLNKAWEQRLPELNRILVKLVHFEELWHGRSMLLALGMARVLQAAAGSSWPGGDGRLTPHIPMQVAPHHEGMLRRGKVLKAKVYCRLVGGLVEVYPYHEGTCCSVRNLDKPHDSGRCKHDALLKSPRSVHAVASAMLLSEHLIRVQVDDTEKELMLYASSSADAQVWVDAFTNAASWGAQSCLKGMEGIHKSLLKFNDSAGSHLPAGLPELAEVMAISETLLHMPPPPPDIPPSPPVQRAVSTGHVFSPTRGEDFQQDLRRPMSISGTFVPRSPVPSLKSVPPRAMSGGLTSDSSASSLNMDMPPPAPKPPKEESDHGDSEREIRDSRGMMRMISGRFSRKKQALSRQHSQASIERPSSSEGLAMMGIGEDYKPLVPEQRGPLISDEESSEDDLEEDVEERFVHAYQDLCSESEDRGDYITLDHLLRWDEMKDLLREQQIDEAEVGRLWSLVLGEEGMADAEGRAGLSGFVRFVQLMDEWRFEQELLWNYNIKLIPGSTFEA